MKIKKLSYLNQAISKYLKNKKGEIDGKLYRLRREAN